MKIELKESDSQAWFNIMPETVDETAMCARIAMNLNSDKPFVSFSFSHYPCLFIALSKRKKAAQKNFIDNKL